MPPAVQSPRLSPHERIVRNRIQTVLGNWVPHVLTQEEIEAIQNECNRRRQVILNLVSKKDMIPLQHRPEFQRQLWAAKLDHDIRYYRTFRINDLPMEILSNILRYIVWSALDPPTGILWRLQLTWVCRHWRNAAIGDPTIWNAIWFRDRPPFTRSLAFVQRSRNSPMDIRINDSTDKPYTYEQVQALLECLTPAVSNIRMLIVLFESWDCILSLLEWLNKWGARVPMILERLEIHRTGSPYHWPSGHFQPVHHPVTLFPLFGGKRLPRLTYITLNSVHCDWNNSVFQDLTTLDIRRIPLELCPNLDRFRAMLSACPRLEKLSMDGAGPSDPPSLYHGKEPVILNALRTFVLANFTINFIHSIITHISAPFVRDLTLMNFMNQDYTPFYHHITNQFREVRLLTLYTVHCFEEGTTTFIRCLDSFPHLTYLRMANLGHDVMGLFLYDPDKKTPHPKLSDAVVGRFRMRITTVPEPSDTPGIDSTTTSEVPPPSPSPPTVASTSTSTADLDSTPTHRDINSTMNHGSSPSKSTEIILSTSTPSSSHTRILCPSLNVIEVQRIDPVLFTNWVEARKQIGVPVVRVYMTPEMFSDLKNASMFKRCQEAIADIHVVTLGAKTPEEDALLRD